MGTSLIKLIEVRRPTLHVGGTLLPAGVSDYIKRRRQASVNMHLSVSWLDTMWTVTSNTCPHGSLICGLYPLIVGQSKATLPQVAFVPYFVASARWWQINPLCRVCWTQLPLKDSDMLMTFGGDFRWFVIPGLWLGEHNSETEEFFMANKMVDFVVVIWGYASELLSKINNVNQRQFIPCYQLVGIWELPLSSRQCPEGSQWKRKESMGRHCSFL